MLDAKIDASNKARYLFGGSLGLEAAPTANLPPARMNVTVAIQYLVNNGELILHNDLAKSGLMGFCDPSPGQSKRLLIWYTWKGRPYRAEGMYRATCTVLQSSLDSVVNLYVLILIAEDTEGLKLPSQGRLVIDLADAEEIMRLGNVLGHEEPAESSLPHQITEEPVVAL